MAVSSEKAVPVLMNHPLGLAFIRAAVDEYNSLADRMGYSDRYRVNSLRGVLEWGDAGFAAGVGAEARAVTNLLTDLASLAERIEPWRLERHLSLR